MQDAQQQQQQQHQQLAELAQACNALWLATLSLMTAYMQQKAPAHRYLLAKRIARNFATLKEQPESFPAQTRASFAELAKRWERKAELLSPEGAQRAGVWSRLQRLWVG